MTESMPQFFGNMGRKGTQHNQQRLQNVALRALGLRQLVLAYHERRYAGVEREVLDVLRDFLYHFVEAFQFFGGRLRIGYGVIH